jgi:hypothetical protein
MTKRFEFSWHIPVPEPLLKGCYFERWTEEKENVEYESKCLFRVDDYGFFIYWKSEARVSNYIFISFNVFVTLRPVEVKRQLCNPLTYTLNEDYYSDVLNNSAVVQFLLYENNGTGLVV